MNCEDKILLNYKNPYDKNRRSLAQIGYLSFHGHRLWLPTCVDELARFLTSGNHRGNPAPLSGILLHCREKSSHDGNKTRQTRTKLASSDPNPNARMDWLSRIRWVCVRCVTLVVCLMCVPCPKWQGLKSPRESCSTVGNPAPLSREKLARWEQNSPDENKTRQQRSQSHTCTVGRGGDGVIYPSCAVGARPRMRTRAHQVAVCACADTSRSKYSAGAARAHRNAALQKEPGCRLGVQFGQFLSDVDGFGYLPVFDVAGLLQDGDVDVLWLYRVVRVTVREVVTERRVTTSVPGVGELKHNRTLSIQKGQKALHRTTVASRTLRT